MAMPLNEIIIPLIAIGLAEMGDKTQLSVILLSSRTREYIPLLAGVMLAFLITDGFAILIGSWMTGIIPLDLLKLISGGVFILFGALILRGRSRGGRRREGYIVRKRSCVRIFHYLSIGVGRQDPDRIRPLCHGV